MQSQLSSHDRLISRFLHNPFIYNTSELSEQTLARPSGLLGGGALSLIGSTVLFAVSIYEDVSYNFLVFIVLFVIGFALGLFIELVFQPDFDRSV